MSLENFTFVDPQEYSPTGLVFEFEGRNVRNQQELFDAFGVGLSAPNGYFGENWNAFKDCLLGLDWLREKEVSIVHHSLPNLSEDELATYLNIVRFCAAEWASPKTQDLVGQFEEFVPHLLKVVFRSEQETTIKELLP